MAYWPKESTSSKLQGTAKERKTAGTTKKDTINGKGKREGKNEGWKGERKEKNKKDVNCGRNVSLFSLYS